MTNRIKVLIFVESLIQGGSERFVINLVKFLNYERFSVNLVLINNQIDYKDKEIGKVNINILHSQNNKDVDNLIKELICNIKDIIKMIFNFFTIGIFDAVIWFLKIADYKKLNDIISKEDPDIIFAINDMPIVMCAVLKKFLSLNRILIFSNRTFSSAYFSHRKRFLLGFLFKLSLRSADSILAQTSFSADNLIDNFGVKQERITTIKNPIDINGIQAQSLESLTHHFANHNNVILLSIGALEPFKGHRYLLKAFKIVKQHNINVKLIIIGKGSEENNLKKIVGILGIEDSVDFIGFDPNPYKYLKISKVFILTSLFEGLPNVVLESMVCRVPVLAFSYPGIQAIINHNSNGVVVPAKNVSMLANAIISLINNKNLADTLVDNGEGFVREFDVDKVISQYEQHFIKMYDKHYQEGL